jgi:glycosyltransferase involved in cell wall biosynthesis
MTNTPATSRSGFLTPSSATTGHSISVMRPRTPLDRKAVSLSVLMPVFNEQATIEAIINYVHAAPIAPIRIELVVVDDYSTDGSREVLQRLHADGKIHKLHLQPQNQGKGAAIRQALGMSTGDIVIVQDADLEYDPADWPVLLAPIIDGKADACFGSRFLGGPHRVLLFWHSVGNTVLTMFSNMLTNLNLTDMETCYKAMRGDIARSIHPHLRSDRFGFEPEITARLAKAHARIFEVPISYSGRTYAEGKKINWKDGVAAFWHIFKYNLLS